MKQRRRIYYSAEQRADIWDRWKRGESAHEIGRLFDTAPFFDIQNPYEDGRYSSVRAQTFKVKFDVG